MFDQGLLERCLDALSAMSEAGIRHKNVFGMRGLMRGKQMFAAVGENNLIIKVRHDELAPALERAGVRRFTPGGQTLGNWIEIDVAQVADDPELREWLAAGIRGIG